MQRIAQSELQWQRVVSGNGRDPALYRAKPRGGKSAAIASSTPEAVLRTAVRRGAPVDNFVENLPRIRRQAPPPKPRAGPGVHLRDKKVIKISNISRINWVSRGVFAPSCLASRHVDTFNNVTNPMPRRVDAAGHSVYRLFGLRKLPRLPRARLARSNPNIA